MDAVTAREILDRTRRIETRITKIGNAMGVDVGGGKPSWNAARRRVDLPSPNCSLSECIAVIPAEMRGAGIRLYVGNQYLTTMTVDS